MAVELRQTGISILDRVPWGTHFCTFYETTQDLLDILVPFFKAGLESGEFCLWIISNSELLTTQEARSALQKALPDLDRHLSEGDIELVEHDQWFLQETTFDLHRVAHRFKEKLDAALAKGYVGMRLNGSPAWIYEEDQKKLIAFEREADRVFHGLPVIASCTYPTTESTANELLDVACTHQFVITRRRGDWEVFETPELIHAQAELKKLNEELEERVIERTKELAATNEALEREMIRRQHAEDHLRLVIDTIPAMVNTALPDGSIDFVNRRWLEYLGLPLTELLGVNWISKAHPDDIAEYMDKRSAAFLSGEPFSGETRVRRADGEWRWLLVRQEPLRDEKRAIVKWYGSSLDIEDRKRAEAALRASEARFQAAVDAADIGLWDWDLVSGQILWFGHHDKLFGLEPGEFEGSYSSFEQLVHPEDLVELNRALQRSQDDRTEYAHEYRVIWPDGSIHWVSAQGRCLYNEIGQPVRMYGAVIDVTERKQAEDRIRLIIDTIPVMAWSLRPDGTVDFLNQRWLDYAGLSWEQYVADPSSPVHPSDFPRALEYGRARMALGKEWDDELRLRRADGEYRWFLVRTEPLLDESGRVIKWYGVSTDIEDRKRAEEQLKATSEQLRALSAKLQSAREEESTRIARELHDELGGALTSLRWDLEEFGDLIPPATASAQLGVLGQKIEAMMTLTEATLDTVRRLSSELRPMTLDVLGLVEAIEWQALQFEHRTGISVQYECSVQKVDLNSAQSTAAFRILQEALTNILRHAQATTVTITMKQEADEFSLVIKDNGKGITENEKSDAHSLGLLGMRERAYLIDAQIDVTGIVGKGTLVALRVPIPGRSKIEKST